MGCQPRLGGCRISLGSICMVNRLSLLSSSTSTRSQLSSWYNCRVQRYSWADADIKVDGARHCRQRVHQNFPNHMRRRPLKDGVVAHVGATSNYPPTAQMNSAYVTFASTKAVVDNVQNADRSGHEASSFEILHSPRGQKTDKALPRHEAHRSLLQSSSFLVLNIDDLVMIRLSCSTETRRSDK